MGPHHEAMSMDLKASLKIQHLRQDRLFRLASLHTSHFRLILGAMATHPSANIRNLAIVGHASSGKTLLSEAMLACSGSIGRMGRIADGSTVSGYHVSERQRHISQQ